MKEAERNNLESSGEGGRKRQRDSLETGGERGREKTENLVEKEAERKLRILWRKRQREN